MQSISRWFAAGVVVLGVTLPAASALRPRHDPRTTAKTLSQGLLIEGAGALSIEYKALHFNTDNFARAKQAKPFLDYLNSNIWGKLGKAKLEFDLDAGGQRCPKATTSSAST